MQVFALQYGDGLTGKQLIWDDFLNHDSVNNQQQKTSETGYFPNEVRASVT
ncbi:hypothetical protein HanIR_Chr11g0521271 [Helianthus annuus]|nr:hypothetical protein HanIR_Chr11g0521271 [Helianthus annuus]